MTLGSETTRCKSALTRVAALLLAAPLFTVAVPAHAEEAGAETRTIAREVALQGATAFESGDYTTALDRFQRASSLFQAPSITLMEARTLVKLGRFVEALDVYESTQRMVLPPDAPEALTLAVADARREGEQLRGRIPWLRIIVQSTNPGEEPRVTLDGKVVPVALLNIERPVDPGSHDVQATLPGLQPARRVVSLGEGEHRVAHLIFDTAPPPTAPRPAPAEATAASPADSSHESNLRAWGYAAGGAGVASLALSAVTGIIALNKKSALDQVCHSNGSCPESAQSDIDAYYVNRTVSWTTFAIGLAGVGTGGYILLTGSNDSSHVAAGVSGTGAWVRGKF